MKREEIYKAIDIERISQDEQYQSYNEQLDDFQMLSNLLEELGEISKDLNDINHDQYILETSWEDIDVKDIEIAENKINEKRRNLKIEIIQLAALAVQWLERK